MYDESVIRRWMSFEMGKINDGVVAERMPLSRLLEMERPTAVTRGGREFIFEKEVVRRLGAVLRESLHPLLRLPVVFYFDMEVADSCMLVDEIALAAFQELGDLSRDRRMDGGKAWVGRALVFGLVRKYPTAVQIMMR